MRQFNQYNLALCRWFALVFLAVIFTLSCDTVNVGDDGIDESEIDEVPADSRMKIVGYVSGWSDPDIENIHAEKLTHINYAFANVINNRPVLQRGYDASNLSRLNALKARNPDLKILVSVGGWTWSRYFSDAALTPASRLEFAESVTGMIREHELDGIDLGAEGEALFEFLSTADARGL